MTLLIVKRGFRHQVLLGRRDYLSSATHRESPAYNMNRMLFLGTKKTIRAEKTSLNVSALLASPACWAGVLTCRPNFNAR
jgi:hypothetical protein